MGWKFSTPICFSSYSLCVSTSGVKMKISLSMKSSSLTIYLIFITIITIYVASYQYILLVFMLMKIRWIFSIENYLFLDLNIFIISMPSVTLYMFKWNLFLNYWIISQIDLFLSILSSAMIRFRTYFSYFTSLFSYF